MVSSVLQVEPVTRAFRVDRHKLDQPIIPIFHRIRRVQRLNVRIAPLDLCKLLLKLIDQDRIGMLVLLEKFLQQIEFVTAKPNRLLGDGELAWHRRSESGRIVNKTRRHLLQLAGHHGSVSGYRLRVGEVNHEVALHRLVGLAIVDRAAHLDDVTRRQFVLVVARLEQIRRRLDAPHDQLQRAPAWRPVTEIAIGANEVLLQERALRAA